MPWSESIESRRGSELLKARTGTSHMPVASLQPLLRSSDGAAVRFPRGIQLVGSSLARARWTCCVPSTEVGHADLVRGKRVSR